MWVNGIDYHIEVEGNSAPLLLLHGFTGSSENWMDIRPALNPYFTTITIDLPGHGQTTSSDDPLRYTMGSTVDDLAVICTNLGFSSVNLLGYSMGGRLALYMAVMHPELIHTLILESASPGLATEAERRARIENDEALAHRIETDGLETFVDYWTNLPLFSTQNDDLRQRLRSQRSKNNPAGLANSLRGMGTGAQPSLWHRLKELTCPTLLIAGEYDGKFTHIAHQMATDIPNTQVEIVPNAGHTVHLEQPETYVTSVLRFLRAYN
jgi:2-succinyl-6-hydroxy-2,4-cyclohexadiene-1-carboxylate synthase